MDNASEKSRFKRLLLWGMALTALFLLGAGAWFYITYFVSTDAAIHRAEAFRIRRMTVSQLAEQGEYSFFYVTNRRPGTYEASIEQRFGTELEERLKRGGRSDIWGVFVWMAAAITLLSTQVSGRLPSTRSRNSAAWIDRLEGREDRPCLAALPG